MKVICTQEGDESNTITLEFEAHQLHATVAILSQYIADRFKYNQANLWFGDCPFDIMQVFVDLARERLRDLLTLEQSSI